MTPYIVWGLVVAIVVACNDYIAAIFGGGGS